VLVTAEQLTVPCVTLLPLANIFVMALKP